MHRYAVGTAGATFLLLIAGGLVTSTDSGLAVPDWPLSYGMWFPPMVGGILFEHGHRMVAGIVGLMILGLAIWLWRVEPHRWVRRIGYAALAAVFVQALLGGLTVLLLLPPQVSIAHACLGQAVFCLLVCVAYATAASWSEAPPATEPHGQNPRGGVLSESLDSASPRSGRVLSLPKDEPTPPWRGGASRRIEDRRRPSLRTLALAVATLAACQLFLGAVIRHTGSTVTWHLAGATALVLAAGWSTARVARLRGRASVLWAHAVRLIVLVGAQVAWGIAVLGHRGSVMLRTGHVGLGALVLAQAVVLAWEIARRAPDAPSGIRYPVRKKVSDTRIWRDYLELTKPRLSALVLVTTALAYGLGRRAPEPMSGVILVLIGTALVVGGANALNQWSEREFDGLMERTKQRPLPAGRLSPDAACRFGWALSVGGIVWLSLAVNMLSGLLAAISWAVYVLLYTPLKRRTPLCTLVGAVPGALPPLIGWAGARGALGFEAWILFAILFIWQLPHFLALAVLYRDDYARAGFRMLTITEPHGLAAARQTALYGLALLPLSLVPAVIGAAGRWYFYGAFTLSLAFLGLAVRAAWIRSRQSCRQLFLASVLYLPVLLSLLVFNRRPL